ncbi:MAG: FeS-binding protein [Deltaproteobacteria bacterium]|nr:MAG: FeS-binding protein [Deltaproteobacteria bacterium]
MENNEPENTARMVVDACSDCDVCRFLMDSDCLMFPELYRFYDNEIETGKKITSKELRKLVDLCNFCALCPCPNIRADIIQAKTQFIDREVLKFGVRMIEDVERIGKLCGTFPGLANFLLRNRITGQPFKKTLGIHHRRRFPDIPARNFPTWVRKHRLHIKRNPGNRRKVAYFAGCTGRYLFPDVPKAAVEVLQTNGVEVYYPEQKCCGMPTLLEGDRQLTMQFVNFNIEQLSQIVEDGYDIVCSCPTCGYFLKIVLSEGAYYSPQYQQSIGAGDTHIKIPAGRNPADLTNHAFVLLKKSIYQSILKDEGYFSTISPRKRILVAEHTFDLSEYLGQLQRAGELRSPSGKVTGKMVYYPPCHAREQNIGRPYTELLRLVRGIDIEAIDGHFYCCGMAGVMGFKKGFHESSIQLGQRLMDKIREINPDGIVTDCLSCRLQFNQLLPYQVLHPVEIFNEAYSAEKTHG